jgi:IS1 family transposase
VLFVILIFENLDEEVLPFKRHRPVDKESGKTSHIERLNNTLRQRISRLVRKTLSLSKKLLAPYWGNF